MPSGCVAPSPDSDPSQARVPRRPGARPRGAGVRAPARHRGSLTRWRPALGKPVRNVLFLCTGNSARSIMAECALARLGAGRFGAFSAGSHPIGRVHPLTLECLGRRGYATGGLRSKGWEEFAVPGAPDLDFVFTVCDAARAESCPAWPGRPGSAHWGVPDPAAFVGPEEEALATFDRVYEALELRVRRLVELPLDRLGAVALQETIEGIGRSPGPY